MTLAAPELKQDLSTEYFNNQIRTGDDVSETLKIACRNANKESFVGKTGLLSHGGKIINSKIGGLRERKILDKSKNQTELDIQIDGVGTKIRIYMRKYEALYKKYEENDSEANLAELINIGTELMFRMLCDFFAMNTDDLRDGEMALGLTNIIDVNQLDGKKGKIFGECMARAMEKIIKETQIAILGGETALLGESQNCTDVINLVKGEIAGLDINISLAQEKANRLLALADGNQDMLELVSGIIEDTLSMKKCTVKMNDGIEIIKGQIDMNLGGSIIGAKNQEKLVPLKSGQRIVAFQEKYTEGGIIGPRSNGLSLIRKSMESLLGPNWPNLKFSDFKKALIQRGGIENEEIFYKKLAEIEDSIWGNPELWDVSTGITTIFNPLISRDMLGGLEKDPEVSISKIIHVTGNPLKKIANAIGKKSKFDIVVNMKKLPVPPIMKMCQLISGISDEAAMKSLNMGMPKALICNEEDVEKIIEMASKRGITALDIGYIEAKKGRVAKMRLSGIGGSDTEIVTTVNKALK